MRIFPKNLEMSDIKIMDWRVGPLRRQEVSKGVRLRFNIPLVEPVGLEELISKFGVNSWLVRIKRKSLIHTEYLGMFYIPLIVPGQQVTNKVRRNQMKTGALAIYYSAAARSKRFEGFACPAFNHSRRIERYNVEYDDSKVDDFYVNSFEQNYVNSQVDVFSYDTIVFDAGMSLEGEYFLEMALYNFETKRRLSNFVSYPQKLILGGEKQIAIRGCENYKIPAKEIDDRSINQFKFGK